MAANRSAAILRGLLPCASFAFLLGIALWTAPSHYALLDLGLVALVYATLAWALHAGVVLTQRLFAPLGIVGGLAAASVLVWHLREQTFVPGAAPVFAVSVLALGLVYFLLTLGERGGDRARAIGMLLAAGGSFVAVVLLGFYGSETSRWHLLRHNTLVGTPAYLLLAERVEGIRARLWQERVNTSAEAVARSVVVPPAGRPGAAPNLVVVVVDTLRADALAAYGGPPDLMPQTNALARESVVFADVLGNAAWTRPAMASLFTGVLPEEHGAVDRDYGLPRAFRTLAEILRERGYRTAAFVSNFAVVGRAAGFDQGFDHFEEIDGGPDPYARADRVNQVVTGWLRETADSDRPVFLWIHYLDPHMPFLSGGPASPSFKHVREAYDRELRYFDARLPRLLDELDRRLSDSTFLFFTADHGEEFGEHGEIGHGHSLYTEVTKLPALLRTPDRRTDRIEAALEARDFFDLLLRLATPGSVDLADWARARDGDGRYTSIYSTTPFSLHRPYHANVAMRGFELDGEFLIWSAYGSTRELYDLDGDPAQKRNTARAHPDRVRELGEAMEASVTRWAPREPMQHDEKTLELLRKLGYLK